MKLSSQIFTLFGLTLLLTSQSRAALATDDEERLLGGGSDSSSDEDKGACDQIAPLPIFRENGTEASYGTFIDAIGVEKEATYANLAEEYFELLGSVPVNGSAIDVPQNFGDFYLLPFPFKSAGEGDDKVIYVPEGKYTMFALGTLRYWTFTIDIPPPVEDLPPRDILEASIAKDGAKNFVKYYAGSTYFEYQLDQLYAGTFDQTSAADVVIYSTDHELYASELSFFLEKTAEVTVNGCKIPDAINFLTKSKTYPPRSTDLYNDPENPATLKTVTGWFMLLPPLTPGLHYIDGKTYIAQFHPPDSLYPAGFETENARSYNVCVGDPSGCNVSEEGGGKKGGKNNGGKRMLKKKSTSNKNGPRGIRRAAVKTPERRELSTVVKGVFFTEIGHDL